MFLDMYSGLIGNSFRHVSSPENTLILFSWKACASKFNANLFLCPGVPVSCLFLGQVKGSQVILGIQLDKCTSHQVTKNT